MTATEGTPSDSGPAGADSAARPQTLQRPSAPARPRRSRPGTAAADAIESRLGRPTSAGLGAVRGQATSSASARSSCRPARRRRCNAAASPGPSGWASPHTRQRPSAPTMPTQLPSAHRRRRWGSKVSEAASGGRGGRRRGWFGHDPTGHIMWSRAEVHRLDAVLQPGPLHPGHPARARRPALPATRGDPATPVRRIALALGRTAAPCPAPTGASAPPPAGPGSNPGTSPCTPRPPATPSWW